MAQDAHTWNLSKLYKANDDPKMASDRKAILTATEAFEAKWRPRQDYQTDPVVLKEALDQYETWQRNFGASGAEGFYFGLRSAQDQNDPKVKAKLQSITEFGNANINRIQFFELRWPR